MPGLPRRRLGPRCPRRRGRPRCARRLADRLGEEVPETFAVAVPSGGRHLYYRAPMGCTSGGRTALGPGIDVRGPGQRSGGYLVGPGSVIGGRS
ncbi:bifunctional DNA primase/polymerase [Streptomyces sp. NPDC058583]|uniref:bifunctional DNA primase/polymerase n=1 Tax=unclassified Streptomyces TaxID=2593676 RepID=UPI00366631D5